MNVDTQEFAALKEKVAANENRLRALSAGLVAAFQAAGRPVPEEMQLPRPARPRERHLRAIQGGRR